MRSTRSDGSPAWTLIGVHLTLSLERSLEVRMMALATAVGAIVEMSQIATGTYHFTSGTAWLGAAGGPLAFLAGERLGAVALLPPVTHGLLRLQSVGPSPSRSSLLLCDG